MSRRLTEIARVFLKFGVLGFGGPIAILALMEEELCERRKWLPAKDFSELYAVCKLLPGPISVQMAIAIGRIRERRIGGVLAGVCFVFPAFLMMLGLGALYSSFSDVGAFSPALTGMQTAALVVIALSTWRLARPFVKSYRAWGIMVIAGVLTYLYPRWEPVIILAFGAFGAGLIVRRGIKHPESRAADADSGGRPFLVFAAGTGLAGVLDPSLLGELFWVCFKAGAFVFGTGLAIVPLLEGDVVQHYAWLTHNQFMDALAFGQVTPGPVVITATFIGFKAAGIAGAVVATIGMFLPSFINVLVLLPVIWRRFHGSPGAKGFADWAIPAVIGGITAAGLRLGFLTLRGWIPGVLFVLGLLLVRRLPVWVLIPGSGLLGWALSRWG